MREWIKALKRVDRKAIGQDVKTAQYGWPLGMPLIRKLAPGLWEVRSQITEDGSPALGASARGVSMKKKHIGSNFDDFLKEENLLEVSESTATKRVIAFQIAQEMERRGLTKSEMASRMKTSRPAVERLLDPANPSVTLSTLERAASAVGKKLKVELA